MTQQQRGVSLLEMLMALVIAAAVITAGIRYFSVSERGARVHQAIVQIKTLTAASYQWLAQGNYADFRGSNNTTPINLATLCNASLIRCDRNSLQNPWAGNIDLSASTTNPSHIRIILTNIPNTDCHMLQRQLDTANLSTEDAECSGNNNRFVGEF